MSSQVLKLKDVVAITSLSRSTIYRLASSGEFPRPIKLACHASGWLREDVENWLNVRKTVSSWSEFQGDAKTSSVDQSSF